MSYRWRRRMLDPFLGWLEMTEIWYDKEDAEKAWQKLLALDKAGLA